MLQISWVVIEGAFFSSRAQTKSVRDHSIVQLVEENCFNGILNDNEPVVVDLTNCFLQVLLIEFAPGPFREAGSNNRWLCHTWL